MTKRMRSIVLATLPFISAIPPASAELPMMEEPWFGYYAVAAESSFQLLIGATGEFQIVVTNREHAKIEQAAIPLQFLAAETLPDGAIRYLPMKLDSLESSDPPTAKLKKAVFRCKLTDQADGQPTIEITIECVSGTIFANARITDKGGFDKNPLRPVIQMGFQDFYAGEYSEKDTWDKTQIKEFEKRIAKDAITLKYVDGKRAKLRSLDKESNAKEINGSGIVSAELEISVYQSRTIEFIAAPNSSMMIANAATAPLNRGFWVQWSADAVKDPDGKTKVAIRIK